MTQPEPSAIRPLPSGSRIVHIGPSKTGTTSLQASMWEARRRLEAQGVHYAGDSRHSASAARAGAQLHDVNSSDGDSPPAWMWKSLVGEVRASRADRVVLSSEFFAHADDEVAGSIVAELGSEHLQIIVTIRPVAKLLSSLWQQRLQTGSTMTFTRWLETHLGREGEIPDKRIWARHRHDRLVRRWGGIVGTDRMTVIVVDSSDHERILRDFEGLLGLEAGTLHLQDAFDNRSLTLPEARALRVLNRQLVSVGVNHLDHLHIVRDGVARLLKLRTPKPDEARIRLPGWAGERAAAMAHQIAEGIAASGVRVLGDLSTLTQVPELVEAEDPDVHIVPDDIAATMAMGVAFEAGMLRSSRLFREHKGLAEAVEMRHLSNRDLLLLPVERLRRFGPMLARRRLGIHR